MSGEVALSACDLRVVRKASGFTLAVQALDLCAGEVLAILGPNGAGKSTLLRSLAGLEAVGGVVTPPSDGPVTMVFQRPAAFSGSVSHNVRVGLLGSGLSREEIERRVHEALDRLEIGPLAKRRAHALSGGELRRLALARAFALHPRVLLLDEPFDDLDAAGQASLSLDLRRVIRETRVAVAMVTHDLRRALLLADRIAVLIDGGLVQIGARDEVLERPASRAVAELVGMSNLVPGVATQDGARIEVDAQHSIPLSTPLTPGSRAIAGIRPEDLTLDVDRGDGQAIGKGVVRSVVDDGALVTVAVDWAGVTLRSVLLARRGPARSLAPGDPVSLSVRPERVHVMAPS